MSVNNAHTEVTSECQFSCYYSSVQSQIVFMHRNSDVWRISRHWKQLLPVCSHHLYIGCAKHGRWL